MSRSNYAEGATELEKLIHNCEFENQQIVKQIEYEDNLIQMLEKEIQFKKEDTKRLESDISQLDVDTKNYHRQFTINRDNAESLKKTNNVLIEHTAAMSAKLESVKLQRANEKLDYTKTLEHYQSIWKRYKEKYDTFPLAKDLKVLQEKKETLIECIQRKMENVAALKTQIHSVESQKEFQQMDTKTYIIQLAEMHVTSEKIKKEIEQKKQQLAYIDESVKTQMDSELNVQKMTEIQITDGEEEMEGEATLDRPSSDLPSPMIIERDEEMMQTEAGHTEIARRGQDQEMSMCEQSSDHLHNHLPQPLCQKPHQEQDSCIDAQQIQPTQPQQVTPALPSGQVQQKPVPPQVSIPIPRQHLQVPATSQPKVMEGKSEPTQRLQVPSILRSRMGDSSPMVKLPKQDIPQQYIPKSSQHHISQPQLPRSSLQQFPKQNLPKPSQKQLSQQQLPKSMHLLPEQHLPKTSKFELPQHQVHPKSDLPQHQVRSSPLRLPEGFEQKIPPQTGSSPFTPAASPLQLPSQSKVPSMQRRHVPDVTKSQPPQLVINQRPRPNIPQVSRQPSPTVKSTSQPALVPASPCARLQTPQKVIKTTPGLPQASFSALNQQSPRTPPSSYMDGSPAVDTLNTSSIHDSHSNVVQFPVNVAPVAQPQVSVSTNFPPVSTRSQEDGQNTLGLGDTYYLPLKDSHDDDKYRNTPEHKTCMDVESAISPFNMEKHKKNLKALNKSPGFQGFSAERRMFTDHKTSSEPGKSLKIGSSGDKPSTEGPDARKADMFTMFGANVVDTFSSTTPSGMIFNFGGGDAPSAPDNNSDGKIFNFGDNIDTSSDNINTDGNIFSLFGPSGEKEKESGGGGFSFSFGSAMDDQVSQTGTGGALSMFGDVSDNQTEETSAFTFSFGQQSAEAASPPNFKFF